MLRHPAMLVATTTLALGLAGCGSSGGDDPPPPTPPAPLTGWAAIRATAAPQVALPAEYGTPVIQAPVVDGWEDGICISRDGLHLYAVYAPCDLLAFTIAGADQHHAADYLRGPTLGMDLTTNPAGTTTWIHGCIVVAGRASTAVPFGPWKLSACARPTWSEGAPLGQGPLVAPAAGWDLFVYTSNEHAPDYKAHIGLARNAAYDPAALGSLLPAPVTTATTEDNPHIERIDATHLVLFFDSDDRPGASGLHDIWWTASADDGATWDAPQPVASINTALEDEQPHLWRDGGGNWWLYFTATNPADGKLGIFRAKQGAGGGWDAWGARQLVLGAGNTVGVGEPTLTAAGDLSFVVIVTDPHGTATNRYDGDPWFLPRLPGATGALPPSRDTRAAALAAAIPLTATSAPRAGR